MQGIADLNNLELHLSTVPQTIGRKSTLEAYFKEINYSTFGPAPFNTNAHYQAPVEQNHNSQAAVIEPITCHRQMALDYTLTLY